MGEYNLSMKRGLILISILGILGVSSISAKTPVETNAWTSYGSSSKPDELETTFISEEMDDGGVYHYNFHVKNISDRFITEFVIGEPVGSSDGVYKHYSKYRVENNLFDYGTLVIGPNQEVDVEFTTNNKYENIDNVELFAEGYYAESENDFVLDAHLSNNVLSSTNNKISINIENKEEGYTYFAFLKTTIDNEEYYFVAEETRDYVVNGNYSSNGDREYNIELVKVFKKEIYGSDYYDETKERDDWSSTILFAIFAPVLIIFAATIGGCLLIGIIVALSVAIIWRKRRKNS